MPPRTFRRADDIMFDITGDRAVLLDRAGKELITLNPVGTLLWQELDERRETTELVGSLQTRFPDVPRTQLEHDTARFLEELESCELVIVDAGG